MSTVIGDLGCLGIDVAKWRADNRAPLFPGKVNRWLLARTLRDNPSDQKVKTSLLDSFTRWFAGGLSADPWFETSEGGMTTGEVDGIQILNASKDGRARFKDPIKSRESCTIIPTVDGKNGALYVEVVFNYRGTSDDLPWPIDVLQDLVSDPIPLLSLQSCPDKADWMLVSVGRPAGPVRAPKSTAAIATELVFTPVGDVVETAVSSLFRPILIPIWVALGFWAYTKVKKS